MVATLLSKTEPVGDSIESSPPSEDKKLAVKKTGARPKKSLK
jgi:hypothetical protein